MDSNESQPSWRWVVGGMGTAAILLVTMLAGFQSTVDERQDEQIERIAQRGEVAIQALTESQKDIAKSLENTSRSLERTSERLETIDRRGTSAEQQRMERELEDRRNGVERPR